MRRTIALLTVGLSALVLVVAACGAEQKAATPAEVLDRAAQNMESAGSMRYTLDATIESKDMGGKPIPFRGTGVATADDSRGLMTLDFAPMFRAAIEQEAGPGAREFLEQFFGDPEDWRGELRYLGDKGWMRIPGLSKLVQAKPWIELSTDDEPDSGLDLAMGGAPDNPAALLPYLRSLGPVRELGTEKLDGRETTHYRATVELERVPDRAPAGKREQLRKQIQRTIEQTGQRTVPFDIWVDDEALPRRLRFVDVSPPAKDEKYPTTWRATMDILEYGVPVEVTPPPAKDVMTEKQFDNLMEGGNT